MLGEGFRSGIGELGQVAELKSAQIRVDSLCPLRLGRGSDGAT